MVGPISVGKRLSDFQSKGHNSTHYSIMDKIGLGHDGGVHYYEGSSGNDVLRAQAANALFAAIQSKHDSGGGGKIHPPNQRIVDAVIKISKTSRGGTYHDGSPFPSIRATYAAASDAIKIHLIAAQMPKAKREKFFNAAEAYLLETHAPKPVNRPGTPGTKDVPRKPRK